MGLQEHVFGCSRFTYTELETPLLDLTVHEQSDAKTNLIYLQNSFADKPIRLSESSWHKLVLAFLAVVLLCWDLGKTRLADWDEAIYAQISKEILQSHDWMNLSWGHVPWFEKPPLFMWSTAVSFQVFGVNEIGARAVSVICGIAIVLLTYSIGRRLYNAQVGLFGALILLTSIQFVSFTRFGTTDVALCLSIYLALYGYIRVRDGDSLWWYLIWISIGLGAMIKGPAVLIAPIVIAMDLGFSRALRKTFSLREFWLGIICAILIVAPWHLVMIARYHRKFIDMYLWYQVVSRIIYPLEGRGASSVYYVKGLVRGFLPWLLITPLAFALALRENFSGNFRSRIMLLTSGIVLALYTAVQTKLIWYMLPCYPALAVVTAAYIAHLAKRHRYVQQTFFGIVFVTLCVTFYVGVNSAYIAVISSPPEKAITDLVIQPTQQQRAKDNTALLLCARRYLPTPTALFYSNRRQVEMVSFPDDISLFAERVHANGYVDAVIQESLLSDFSEHFAIKKLDQNSDMVYVELKPKVLN